MIDRRRFIGAAVAGGAATALGVHGCAPDTSTGSGGDEARSAASPPPPFELDEVTVAELQAAMESGERTAR